MSDQDDDPRPKHELEQALSRVLSDIEKEPFSPRLTMLARKLEEAVVRSRRKH